MAKPSSDISNSTFSGFGRRSSGVRKRARDSEPIDDIFSYPSKHAKYPEDNTKTRRVNPERLALRLDPDLVAEMDALIIPGAKMPTFAVRKDFQERYQVDRRHIYDYFHSRGLRVAKEDKHNNLTRALSLRKPPIEAEAVPQEEQQEEQEGTMSNSETSDVSTPARPSQGLVRSAKRLASAKISAGIFHQQANSHSQIGYETPRRASLSEMPSLTPNKDDNNHHGGSDLPASPLPDFTLPEEFPDTPLLEDDTWDRMSDSPSEHLPGFPDLDLWYDYNIDLPAESGEPDPTISVHQHQPLTEAERKEFYNLIDQSISPPNGVKECSGTYGAYMKERSRFYFDRLFSKGSRGQSKLYHPDLENRRPDITPREAGDFRKWLSNSASQPFVRAVAHVKTDDITQPVVVNQGLDHHQASSGLRCPNLMPCTLAIASPVWEPETNENTFDDRLALPSRRLCTPSMFTRSASHFSPALLVPAATVHHSSVKLMEDNGTKRSDALRYKLIPPNHGSSGFMLHHVLPNRLRTLSAGADI